MPIKTPHIRIDKNGIGYRLYRIIPHPNPITQRTPFQTFGGDLQDLPQFLLRRYKEQVDALQTAIDETYTAMLEALDEAERHIEGREVP